MTYDDDVIVLETIVGVRRLPCKANGIEWPPPDSIIVGGFIWKRTTCSAITDEERGQMTHVMRGASYQMAGVV